MEAAWKASFSGRLDHGRGTAGTPGTLGSSPLPSGDLLCSGQVSAHLSAGVPVATPRQQEPVPSPVSSEWPEGPLGGPLAFPSTVLPQSLDLGAEPAEHSSQGRNPQLPGPKTPACLPIHGWISLKQTCFPQKPRRLEGRGPAYKPQDQREISTNCL